MALVGAGINAFALSGDPEKQLKVLFKYALNAFINNDFPTPALLVVKKLNGWKLFTELEFE